MNARRSVREGVKRMAEVRRRTIDAGKCVCGLENFQCGTKETCVYV